MTPQVRAAARCLEPGVAAVLTDLLVDEHAAVYAYGVLGARLPDSERRLARTLFDAHRAARDALRSRLLAAGETAPAPLPAYDVRVAGRADALALAVRLASGKSCIPSTKRLISRRFRSELSHKRTPERLRP